MRWLLCVVLSLVLHCTRAQQPETPLCNNNTCSLGAGRPCNVVHKCEWPGGHGSPGPVSDLDIVPYYNYPHGGNLAVGLNISWGLPTLSTLDLEAVLLRVKNVKTNQTFCRVFNYTGIHWTQRDTDLQFFYDCFYTLYGTFLVEAVSFPSRQRTSWYISTPDHGTVKVDSQKRPDTWVTPILYRTNGCTRDVTIRFLYAPESFDYSQYEVQLLNSDRRMIQQTDIPHKPQKGHFASYTFKNVSVDHLFIYLRPESSGTDCSSVKQHCVTSNAPINMTACPPESPPPPPTSWPKLTIIIASASGGLILLVIVGVAAYCIRTRGHENPVPGDNVSMESAEMVNGTAEGFETNLENNGLLPTAGANGAIITNGHPPDHL